jgi:hypothetical protein
MRRLSKFIALERGDRALLVVAILLLAAIRVGLRVLPFARLRSLLARLARGGRRNDDGSDDAARERAVWAIETASRHVPAIGTCLTQALALQVLLARTGCRSCLRIGVTKNADRTFIAHACLEKDGLVLIGGAGHRDYTPMPALDGPEP